MQTKKTIVAVVFVLIATISVIAFTIKEKKQSKQVEAPTQQLVRSNDQLKGPAEQNNENNKPQEFSTVFVEGQVVSFKAGNLEIQNGEVKSNLSVFENALIYAKKGDVIIRKDVKDLSKGTKIKAEIDMKNSTVISIEIF